MYFIGNIYKNWIISTNLKIRVHHVVHAYTNMSARLSYSGNEVLQSINVCAINQNSKRSGLPCVLLRVHFFLFRNMCSLIVGIDDVLTRVMLGSEFSDTHFGECYVITVLWDVTWLTFVIWEKQMMMPPVISGNKKYSLLLISTT